MIDEDDTEALDRQQHAQRLLSDAVAFVMSTSQGRHFVASILDFCGGAWGESFSSDPIVMARNEGVRAVGRFVHAQIDQECPHHCITMKNEQKELERYVTGNDNANTN